MWTGRQINQQIIDKLISQNVSFHSVVPKYCKQLQYLLKGKVLKKFPNMKIESILQIQKIIHSKKKTAYSFSSVILKEKKNQSSYYY